MSSGALLKRAKGAQAWLPQFFVTFVIIFFLFIVKLSGPQITIIRQVLFIETSNAKSNDMCLSLFFSGVKKIFWSQLMDECLVHEVVASSPYSGTGGSWNEVATKLKFVLQG